MQVLQDCTLEKEEAIQEFVKCTIVHLCLNRKLYSQLARRALLIQKNRFNIIFSLLIPNLFFYISLTLTQFFNLRINQMGEMYFDYMINYHSLHIVL